MSEGGRFSGFNEGAAEGDFSAGNRWFDQNIFCPFVLKNIISN